MTTLEQPADPVAYHGWILRDVLFDSGEPVGHREPQPTRECIVKNCENHANQGRFVGDLCSPCHVFITTGEGVYSQAYRNAKREWAGLTESETMEVANKADTYIGCVRMTAARLKEKNA